jgi:hypothetical protein
MFATPDFIDISLRARTPDSHLVEARLNAEADVIERQATDESTQMLEKEIPRIGDPARAAKTWLRGNTLEAGKPRDDSWQSVEPSIRLSRVNRTNTFGRGISSFHGACQHRSAQRRTLGFMRENLVNGQQ